MTFIEFLGFVISLVAMVFLVVKHFWEENRRRRYPVQYAEEKRKKDLLLSEFMKNFDVPGKGTSRRTLNEYEEEEEEEDDDDLEEEVVVRRPLPPVPKKSLTPRSVPKVNTGSMKDSYEDGMVSSRFLKQEASAYDIAKKSNNASRSSMILKDLHSRKNMLIIKEIFDPPKSMRDNPWD